MFEVKLKPAHPTGVYHRAGIEFNKTEPVRLEALPDAVADDPHLIVKKIEEDPVMSGVGVLDEGGAKGKGKGKKSDAAE